MNTLFNSSELLTSISFRPSVLEEFNILSKQYDTLCNELYKAPFSTQHEEFIVYPDTLEDMESLHMVSEYLRTRLDPEIEEDDNSLVKVFEEERNEKIEHLKNDALLERLHTFSNMIEDITGDDMNFTLKRAETTRISTTDNSSHLESILKAIRNGEKLAVPVATPRPNPVMPQQPTHHPITASNVNTTTQTNVYHNNNVSTHIDPTPQPVKQLRTNIMPSTNSPTTVIRPNNPSMLINKQNKDTNPNVNYMPNNNLYSTQYAHSVQLKNHPQPHGNLSMPNHNQHTMYNQVDNIHPQHQAQNPMYMNNNVMKPMAPEKGQPLNRIPNTSQGIANAKVPRLGTGTSRVTNTVTLYPLGKK